MINLFQIDSYKISKFDIMRYKLLIILFFICSSFNSIYSQGTIAVSMDIPQYIAPGKELTVNLRVDRGVTEGYVKIEEFFPLGIVATPVESQGAEFSFSNNYLTIVWKDIPKEDVLKLKFKLSIPSTMEGKAKFEGRVNFLVNNKLTKTEFEDFNVTFQSEDADEETTKEIETPRKVIVGLPNKTKGSIEKIAKVELPITINAKRTFTVLNADELLVQIEIDQTNLTGFLKHEDMIPMGFKIKNENNSGSTFTFMENKVKYVWSEVPKENKIITSYRLIRDGNDAKKLTLDGSVQYLDKGESKKIELKNEDINFDFIQAEGTEKPSVAKSASNVAAPNSNPNPNPNPNPKPVAKSEPKPVVKKVVNVATKPASEFPKASKGIKFKVQICATQNKSDAQKVSQEFNITEEIESEMQDGWYKYTIGVFGNYNDAKSFSDSKSSIPTRPFVSAYYNGKRISVQEALMINSQKLMK